jgi:hypothetical protein
MKMEAAACPEAFVATWKSQKNVNINVLESGFRPL